MLDFMLQKLNQVACNSTRGVILWCIGLRLIRVVALDDGHNALWVNRNVWGTDTVFR
jgi:hypothetical protein